MNTEPLFRDGHEQINAQPDPYLALHCVHGSAIKRLDPQVLLDPLEKKLDSPALFVNVGNRFRRDVKIVREKHQMFLSLFVNVTDSAQPLRVCLLRFLRCQGNHLVGPDACFFIFR